ncbi:MAG: SGNH/GDSL hydrolase family protein [Clostridia bacterium]|nr:SGNH/GDSL hydrolase family protein [Clostridia bacterium]
MMKLTLSQIKAATFGAARIQEIDGKTLFFRFSEAQEAVYRNQSNVDFYNKTFDTAGVRLEFRSDCTQLTLGVECVRSNYDRCFAFDLYADGKPVGQLAGRTVNSTPAVLSGCFALPEGEKTVCIYFPWCAAGRLLELSLNDGATFAPVTKPVKLLMFGDSITHGVHSDRSALTYATRLTDALGAESRNKGIGGEFFRPELAEAKEEFDPDYITVAYGTNDWSKTPRETFDRNSKAFYHALAAKYPQATIFALTPIWRTNHDATDKQMGPFTHVEEHIRAIAAEIPQMKVIYGFDLVPHDIRLYDDHYLHPNAEGFGYYAANLLEAIKPYLK